MIRSSAALAARTFDLLVVGGGVYGMTIVYDAAQRGLSVALIERDDFGSGSSFNHARTIHGGLRYLQSLDVARSRESIRERRTLARIAPHAVAPIPFVLPLKPSLRSLTMGPLALRAAFLLDRVVARDRNDRVPDALRLPAGQVVSAGDASSRFPMLNRHQLGGAAIWYDYVTTEADRLTLSWGLAAAAHSATLANYVEATELVVQSGRVAGARIRDYASGQTGTVAAHVVVCACGGATDRLLEPLGLSAGIPFLEAMNLVVDRAPGGAAIGGRTATGKTFFMVPYHGRLVCGTWESSRAARPDGALTGEPDIDAFLESLNDAFPAAQLSRRDVSLVHRGIVPAIANGDGSVRLEGHERVRGYQEKGVDRLVTVLGAKYTTARGVAERVTDMVVQMLGSRAAPCRTAETPLVSGARPTPGGASEAGAQGRYRKHISEESLTHLVASYGPAFGQVADLALTNPEWCERIDERSPVIGAELVWATRHEMVVTLADAVLRRTCLGALGRPGSAGLERAARLVGNEFGWPEERRQSEVAGVQAFYDRRATAL